VTPLTQTDCACPPHAPQLAAVLDVERAARQSQRHSTRSGGVCRRVAEEDGVGRLRPQACSASIGAWRYFPTPAPTQWDSRSSRHTHLTNCRDAASSHSPPLKIVPSALCILNVLCACRAEGDGANAAVWPAGCTSVHVLDLRHAVRRGAARHAQELVAGLFRWHLCRPSAGIAAATPARTARTARLRALTAAGYVAEPEKHCPLTATAPKTVSRGDEGDAHRADERLRPARPVAHAAVVRVEDALEAVCMPRPEQLSDGQHLPVAVLLHAVEPCV